MKTERYRSREEDLMRQYDNEKKKKQDAVIKEQQATERQKELAQQLGRQIKLKEMFEDKLKDTLNAQYNQT